MNIIFNTVPSLILDKSKLLLMSKNCLVIDLASKPYGVDFESAKKLGIKTIIYSGIPGKVAAKTSANYIKEYVYKNI